MKFKKTIATAATVVATGMGLSLGSPAEAYNHPLPGAAITSCYGSRWGMLHEGIDFAAPTGTPIRAVVSARVKAAGWMGGYGNAVILDHGSYDTMYGHMSYISVTPGQYVRAGRTIGRVGSTGDSTGPHLHFEVHMGDWNQVNPAGYLRERKIWTGC